MTGAYQVHGADQLAASMRAAGEQLGDLDAAHKRAGDAIVAATRPRTPVRTGRLVGSLFATVNPTGVVVGASAPYAGFVHAANPFLIESAKAVEPTVLGYYADAVNTAVEGVKGA
jgi:hypothetical protein